MVPNTTIPIELLHCRLNDEAITNPYDGIAKFFDVGNITEIRQEFNLLKEMLIAESFGEMEPNDKYMMIHFLDRVELLFESGYIIHKSGKPARQEY